MVKARYVFHFLYSLHSNCNIGKKVTALKCCFLGSRVILYKQKYLFLMLLHDSCVQLLKQLDSFIVVERDGSIIACAALFPFFEEKSGEVAAIAVSPECRGHGQGDKLLGMLI